MLTEEEKKRRQKEATRKWSQKHPEKIREYNHRQYIKRKAQKGNQNAEQTEDVAMIEKVAARFGMTAEQALIAIKAARKQNEQKAKEGGAECQNTPV